ncbi:SNF2-related protein [Dactylosporangium aurantiacum]|nr:DEAD/DEAH box helicase [Dactylosporangium aurantiacum]MDG6106494.1 DEAD/DEAH box helicase [Dactylosporangium aurantiacum]
MNVVHGVITAEGRLACWAETTPGPASGVQRRPRRAVPHPFAVLPPLPGEVGTADLALPTVGSRPAPSPELAAATAGPAAATRTMLWTVPIVYVPPATDLETLLLAGIDLLVEDAALGDAAESSGTTNAGVPAPATADAGTGVRAAGGVRAGSSIGALTDLVTFADDLVRRGRVLPDLLDHPIEARWRPVLWGDDAMTFEALWRAMPGVAYAGGDLTAEEAVRAVLDHQVDALVRARLGDRPIVADGQIRQDGTVRAWLAALTGPDATLRERPAAGGAAVVNGDRENRRRPDAVTAAATDHRASDPSPDRASDAPADASRHPAVDATNAATNTATNTAGTATRTATGTATVDGDATGTVDGGATSKAGGGGAGRNEGAGVGVAVRESTDVRRVRDAVRRWAASGRPSAVRLCFRLTFVEEFDDEPDDAVAAHGRGARDTTAHGGRNLHITPHRPAGRHITAVRRGAMDASEDGPAGHITGPRRGGNDTLGDGDRPAGHITAPHRRESDTPGDGDGPAGHITSLRRGESDTPGDGDGPADPYLAGNGHGHGRGDARVERGPGHVDDGRDTSGWLVEFLLQPVAEPGLLVPARDVWRDASSPLFRWVDYPQDVLLEDLGRASRLWAELDGALHQARPEQLRLDTVGAYDFLRHAGVLHDAGFGVLLPAQWQRRQDLGLTLTTHPVQPASPVLRDTTANRDAIVRYRWGLAIGDEFLSEADLQELARAKVPLVRLRGRWVHLDRERLRAGLAFLARGGQGHMTAGEAMRLVRLVPEGDLPLPVTGVDGTGWLADLLTGRAVERLELLDAPASLATTLRPYQRKGLSWLAFLDGLGVGALLADDMGLGKTVQVLALEALLRERGPRPPTLVVCPLSVLGNWRREIGRFTPGLRVAVHHGTERQLRDDVDLVLTTYQVATRDADRLAARDWDRIVLDEAQHVKNSTSAAARAVRRIPARHRVALTGTPVENRLTELWSIADFLNPGILGPASIFRARYSVPVERYGDADAAARLRRVTRPFLLRRVKTDRAVIADLPDKLERRQWCNLTLEQATLYKAVVDELFVKLREGRAGEQRKGLVLSAMTKLKQVCNHPAHLMGDGTPLAGRSGKLARLEEILAAALDAGDRALVFTQFAKFGHLLTPYLAARLGTGVEFLHGGTAKGARDAMVQRFQSGDGPGVLLLSLKAGGTGLNLTAANHVVHVDRWWNPATEQQATDRAFRIGQRRDVQVHTFVCVGTIEERVDAVMAEKRTLAGVAVGSGEGWLTGLSTDDLLDLMTLRPEATDA